VASNVRFELKSGLLRAYCACLTHAVLQMFGSEEAEIPIHMALWRSPAPDPRLVLTKTPPMILLCYSTIVSSFYCFK
jgi:hypothetical protein